MMNWGIVFDPLAEGDCSRRVQRRVQAIKGFKGFKGSRRFNGSMVQKGSKVQGVQCCGKGDKWP